METDSPRPAAGEPSAWSDGGKAPPVEPQVPPGQTKARRLSRWLWTLANWAIIVIVFWAIRRTLLEAWRELGQAQWQWSAGWLGVAGLSYLLGLLPAAIFWYLTLHRLGQRPRLIRTCLAYAGGAVGKYVPGKIFVIFLRTLFVSREGVAPAIAAASVLYETLTMMGVGAFWGGCYLLWQSQFQRFAPVYWMAALGMFVLTMLSTFPPLFRRSMRWLLPGLARSDPAQVELWLSQMRVGIVLAGWVLMSLLWLCWGISLAAVLAASGQVKVTWAVDIPASSAAVALATVIGFAAVAIPGGLGVREAALAGILVPLLGGRTAHPHLLAVVSAALLRVVWILTEVVLFAIVMMAGRGRGREDASAA